MIAAFRHLIPQPLTAILINILALVSVALSWQEQLQMLLSAAPLPTGVQTIFLTAAATGAGLLPIHIRHNIKVILTTVPLYTAALLLPPLAAGLVAGASVLFMELRTRAQRGNTPSDIATAAGRWALINFWASWAAHWGIEGQLAPSLVLIGVAAFMFAGDILTGAFEIAPMSNESPWRVMGVLLRELSLAESVQYLVGMLAVLAAWQQPWSLALWVLPICIIYQAFKGTKEMHDGTARLLESLADAVDLRDPYTGGHSRRVTEFSLQILREMNIMGPEVDLIRSAARVHDIGKIGIPDQILNKPDRLTDEEKRIMDSHADRGAELLARHKDFRRGVAIVRHHHERWDGAGYPAGLKGLDIPLGARVIAVADSFDAMTSDRPYRAGMPVSQAARILAEGRGRQWDPAVVDAFLRALGEAQPEAPAPVDAGDAQRGLAL